MDWIGAPSTRIQSLAAIWHVWAQLLIVFARRGLVMERGHFRGALKIAEDIEVFAAAGAHLITKDIACVNETTSAPDRHAAEQLQVIAQVLILLAWFARDMKNRMLADSAFNGFATVANLAFCRAPARGLPFLDSG